MLDGLLVNLTLKSSVMVKLKLVLAKKPKKCGFFEVFKGFHVFKCSILVR